MLELPAGMLDDDKGDIVGTAVREVSLSLSLCIFHVIIPTSPASSVATDIYSINSSIYSGLHDKSAAIVLENEILH